MAHVRRKFVDIFQSQGSQIAEEAIRRNALLYAVEKAARGKSPDERVALRQTGNLKSVSEVGSTLKDNVHSRGRRS